MFLKRSLVVMVGILLFIGVFLFIYHFSQQRIDNAFKQEREKYGVEGQVLTAAVVSTDPPSFAPLAPPPPAETPAPPPAPADSSADTTPAPGNAPDTNTIIGPLPPSATSDQAPVPAPETVPAPEPTPMPAPTPAPDTNSGPMMPGPSGMIYPPENHLPDSPPSAHRLVALALRLAQTQISQATNPPVSATNTSAPVTSLKINATPPVSQQAPIASAPAHPVAEGGRAIILGFHQFTAAGVPSKNIYSMRQDIFESEMQYLHDNGYNVVPLSDVVAFIEHKKQLPPNAVAITIDDGYKSALNYAWPVLKKFNYPWTYFVYPAFITRTEGKGAASWPDLVELDKEGVDVECHSMTHPQLSKKIHAFNGSKPRPLTPEEYDQFLTTETLGAKQVLEKELNKPIKYFAYPYGDYNKVVEAKVVAAGFEAIFTVAGNPVHVTTDIHSIGRYIITKPDEPHFVGFLHQGALSLAQVDPEPGAITSNPNPVISAVLGFNGDPASIETEVQSFGIVRHDFDPQTSTVRLYLPHPLIQPAVLVSIRAKDEQTGQLMVANWHFNYEPTGVSAPVHAPIGPSPESGTNSAPAAPATAPTPVTTSAPVPPPMATPPASNSAPAGPAQKTATTP